MIFSRYNSPSFCLVATSNDIESSKSTRPAPNLTSQLFIVGSNMQSDLLEMDDIQHLYKFRALTPSSINFVERIFTENELYFARPSEFNDPFDCKPKLSLDATKGEFVAYLDNIFKRRLPHLSSKSRRNTIAAIYKDRSKNHKSQQSMDIYTQAARAKVETAGICSFAEHPNHVLMWSHYAGCHKGICIRFKASSVTPFFGYAQKVAYQQMLPVVNIIKDSYEEQMAKTILVKASFWEYEREWRIVEHEKGPGVHKFPSELLDGVILGLKTSVEDRERVVSWINNQKHHVEVFQAVLSKDDFAIEVIPVTHSRSANKAYDHP